MFHTYNIDGTENHSSNQPKDVKRIVIDRILDGDGEWILDTIYASYKLYPQLIEDLSECANIAYGRLPEQFIKAFDVYNMPTTKWDATDKHMHGLAFIKLIMLIQDVWNEQYAPLVDNENKISICKAIGNKRRSNMLMWNHHAKKLNRVLQQG